MTDKTALNDGTREIYALVRLLDDPDPFVQQQVSRRLIELGEKAVPILDQIRSKEKDSIYYERLDRIMYELTEGHFELEMAERINAGIDSITDLENAMFTLSKFDEPTLDMKPFRTFLDNLAAQAFDYTARVQGEKERVEAFLHFMFHNSGFHGRLEEYHVPENSFIHSTIQQKTGLPLALAMVVLFVSRRVGLDLQGMNMPIHFMLLYRMERQTLFIDPFGDGQFATYDQCYYFLKQNGVTPRADHFRPAPPKEMFSRSLRNLIFSYQKQNILHKANRVQTLLNMVEMDPNKVWQIG